LTGHHGIDRALINGLCVVCHIFFFKWGNHFCTGRKLQASHIHLRSDKTWMGAWPRTNCHPLSLSVFRIGASLSMPLTAPHYHWPKWMEVNVGELPHARTTAGESLDITSPRSLFSSSSHSPRFLAVDLLLAAAMFHHSAFHGNFDPSNRSLWQPHSRLPPIQRVMFQVFPPLTRWVSVFCTYTSSPYILHESFFFPFAFPSQLRYPL